MIALGETAAYAAEVPFYLGTTANPLTGLTGHTFVLGEVTLRLPGTTSFVNIPLVQIFEVGFGWYVVRLTSGQTSNPGVVYVSANVSGADAWLGKERIDVLGGDLAVNEDGVFPFFLANATNPTGGAPVTGNYFSTGDVQIRLPDASVSNANVSDISEIGFGEYALSLDVSDTGTRGKVFLYATASGAQRFLGYLTILGTGAFVPPAPTPPVPAPVIVQQGGPSLLDHVAGALSRLCEYAKDKS